MNQQDELAVLNACTKSRRLTIGCTGEGRRKPDIPYLRLRGRWLGRAGFPIGGKVKIDVSKGRLIIEPVS